jgi:LmbE family N-acetylglucosaminyl deacetylase
MKWMRERDLLIAQTMAFVQSVTGKKPDAEKLFANNSAASTVAEASQPVDARSAGAPAAFIPDLDALLTDTTIAVAPTKPVARPDVRIDFQSEIKARVANFRAHQERFHREREAYCSATMAKVHAALREDAVPPRLGK